jgi:hypothetical protein
MASTNTVPSIWEVSDLEAWAYRVKLSDESVATCVGGLVDGPTLVMFQQEELRAMLGNLSLPARHNIWEIIEGLRSLQQASDFSIATESLTTETPDESGGQIPLNIAVAEQGSDAAQQRQVLEDRSLALRLQDACRLSQQTSEDADMARNEQFLKQKLVILSDFDRKYAASLGPCGQRPSIRSPDTAASLLDLAIDAFVKNRANVFVAPNERGVISEEGIEDRANALESLQTISRCNVELRLQERQIIISERFTFQTTSKMYCPTCSRFINLDLVDSSESTRLLCSCGTMLCTSCKTASHDELSCIENRANTTESDDLLFELSCTEGRKRCPGCKIKIFLLKDGWSHTNCANYNHEYCFSCLRPWQEAVSKSKTMPKPSPLLMPRLTSMLKRISKLISKLMTKPSTNTKANTKGNTKGNTKSNTKANIRANIRAIKAITKANIKAKAIKAITKANIKAKAKANTKANTNANTKTTD